MKPFLLPLALLALAPIFGMLGWWEAWPFAIAGYLTLIFALDEVKRARELRVWQANAEKRAAIARLAGGPFRSMGQRDPSEVAAAEVAATPRSFRRDAFDGAGVIDHDGHGLRPPRIERRKAKPDPTPIPAGPISLLE